MDTITRYHKILVDYLSRQADVDDSASTPDDVRSELVVDTARRHYQLLFTGWKDDRYHFFVAIHFAIRNEKIWLLWNRTELEVTDDLMSMGVPAEDIVLGLRPPFTRSLTGFAVA